MKLLTPFLLQSPSVVPFGCSQIHPPRGCRFRLSRHSRVRAPIPSALLLCCDDKLSVGLVPAPEYLPERFSPTLTGPALWEGSPRWNRAKGCALPLTSRSKTSESRARTEHSKTPRSPISPPTWWSWPRSSHPHFTAASARLKPSPYIPGLSLVSGLRCRGSGVCSDTEARGYRSVDLEPGRPVCLTLSRSTKCSQSTICQ
jgi:hypothetical protein